MKVIIEQPAKLALATLGHDDRQRVESWLDYFRNWNEDEFVRSRSQKLSTGDDVYVFRTSSDVRIFFKLGEEEIRVIDIVRNSTLRSFGYGSDENSRAS